MKKILERNKLDSVKKPPSKKDMDKWENMAKHLIYPQRLDEWREMGAGVWYGITDFEYAKKAVEIMQKLHDGKSFDQTKQYVINLKKKNSKDYDIIKIMKIVLHFSKMGPEFFSDYYNITDSFCNQKIERIKIENEEFKRNLEKKSEREQ